MEEKLEKLFTAARNARDVSDDSTALKHYEEISAIEPNSWEAMLYLVVLKTRSIKNGEIESAAVNVMNVLPKVFELINTTISDEQAKKQAVKDVVGECYATALMLNSASKNFYKSLTKETGTLAFTGLTGMGAALDAKQKARYASAERSAKIGNIMCVCGNAIESIFGLDDDFYHEKAVFSWKKMIDIHFEHIAELKTAVYNDESINRFAQKIREFDSDFTLPDIKATGNRNYNILGIILTILALGVGILMAISYSNIYNY